MITLFILAQEQADPSNYISTNMLIGFGFLAVCLTILGVAGQRARTNREIGRPEKRDPRRRDDDQLDRQ